MPAKPPWLTKPEILSPIEQALRRLRGLAEKSASLVDPALTQVELSLLLRAAVERAASRSSGSMDELRLAVCAFALALRDEGMTPEAVLILFKSAIHQQVLQPTSNGSTWGGPELQDTITTWCINDYFSDQDCAYLSLVSA